MKHHWDEIQFEKGGPYLWQCAYCKEVSYDDLPDAKLVCKGRKNEETPAKSVTSL